MSDNTLVVVILVALLAWFAFGWGGSYVARVKRRSTDEGFLFGFLLGPIGILIEALLPMGPETVDAPRARGIGGRLTAAFATLGPDADDGLVALRVNGVDLGRVPRADAEEVRSRGKIGYFRSTAEVVRFLDELEARRSARPAR